MSKAAVCGKRLEQLLSVMPVMLLVIVSLVIHYYVITYDHVITEMNNENAMHVLEREQSVQVV